MFCCMPVMSRSEDYLKTIYALVSRDEPVTTSGLALELGVSSPSVSAMAKRLQTEQLLQRPGGGWVLTEQGERAALRVIRRHRLVSLSYSSRRRLLGFVARRDDHGGCGSRWSCGSSSSSCGVGTLVLRPGRVTI